jgi:nucleoside-diphosphate-sugar epimerase
MSAPNVIIFGATGAVASTAALTAHTLGSPRITLATRDPSKPLPNAALATAVQSHPSTFPRVQADLTSPDTVSAAVAASGAKVAFLYLVFGAPDGLRGSIEAIKAAGIEFVVFLSSAGIKEGEDLRGITPANFIAWQHARVEIALEEVFGREGFVAVRPGYFASNLLQYGKDVAKGGVVRMVYPEARFDFVVPEDIGRVCGRLLVEGKGQGVNVVPLAGPQMISQGEAVEAIAKMVGQEVQVVGFEDDEEAVKATMQNLGLPEPGARQLVQGFKAVAGGHEAFEKGQLEKGVGNILRYGGKVTRFQEWAEENKAKFS